jgi:hypothetical protein
MPQIHVATKLRIGCERDQITDQSPDESNQGIVYRLRKPVPNLAWSDEGANP